MKKQPGGSGHFDPEDTFGSLIEGAARLAFWLGLLATFVSIGFLLFAYSKFSGQAPPTEVEQAKSNIEILAKVLLAGVVGILVGTTFMFWGEETMPILQIAGAAALWTSPLYVPSMLGGNPTPVASQALAAIQMGGTIFGILAVGVLIIDITARIKLRAKMGTKADQLKYGKNVKEEKEIRNVFMGRCYQLPFCRKFVRERCPIYHARRTCWKEGVGCMCEEEVIRGAMESRTIPKDIVAAAKYIPVNNKLTASQKLDRCKQCVIYNEHQKHKYKLMLPVTVLILVGLYAAMRGSLLEATGGVMRSADKVLGKLTFSNTSAVSGTVEKAPAFQEIFLICMLVIVLAYALKMLEYCIFKLKI